MLAYGFGGVDQDIQKAKMVLEPEIELGNVFAEANYFVIVSDFPNDAAELRVAINQLNRLAFSHFDEPIEQAAWQLAWIHLNPNWKEEVGDKFGFSQNPEKGYAAFASLLDSYHGLTLAQDFITLELGAQFSQRQGQEVISKLIAIATNPFEIDEASSVEAANILAQIYENGIFGPIDKSKVVEFYELAATEYDDGESAVAAGWEYWASPEIYDLAKAFEYTQLATSSKEFLMRAYAHNNLGVFYSYSSERNTKMALAEFQKSVEYFEMMDFTLDWPFNNVARIYLFGDDPKLRDIKTAAEFAAKSDKNDGTGYLTDFIQKYPINEKSALSEIRQWLEKDAREGEPSAFIELAYFLEIHGSDEEVITWFTLCRTLCLEEDKKRALDALGRYGRTMRGALFSIADANATEWINEEYLKVSNEIAANTERDASNTILLNGDFHALLIGVSKYQHLESLGTPIRDISAIEAALKSRYGAKTKTLMNPIRSEITTELNRLVKSLSPEDALLVYFAGHGYLDDAASEGYWLPSDAEKDDDTNYISNGYIRGKLRAIPAKNVLLIADSCFSGSIISRGIEIPKVSSPKSAIEKYLETKSRVSITSGGLKPVLDGGGGSHSMFAAAFIEVLQEQVAPFTSADLYLKLRDSVTQKSLALGYDQTPLRGEMPNHGHDGPDFVFLPK